MVHGKPKQFVSLVIAELQTAKSTFTGAFWGAAGGVINFEIGSIENTFSRIAAHSVSEGAMEGIRGGHFEHGLLVGFVASSGGTLINTYGSNLNNAERVAANAILGGVVSELGGGKFANGAMTAAYVMMFNDLKHLRERQIRQYKKFILSDGKLSFEEAYTWYKIGTGEMLTVDASKINLNFLDVSKLEVDKVFGVSTWKGGIDQGIVYGTVKCIYKGNSLVEILNDKYDFDPHGKEELLRNIETKIADILHGQGKPFNIQFQGLNKVSVNSLRDFILQKIYN